MTQNINTKACDSALQTNNITQDKLSSFNELYKKLQLQNYKHGLYIIATPIGNLFDISLRALYVLSISDIIFAEDTRVTKKLLSFFNIKNKVVSCNQYSELNNTNLIKNGKIFSFVSDAGTPIISDPGSQIVKWCIENNIQVFPIPGASAVLAGISVSNVKHNGKFFFYGFLDRKTIKDELRKLSHINVPIIFFESPHRIKKTLNAIYEIIGNCYIYIGRELTKAFEEHLRGDILSIIQELETKDNIKGEFVIVIEKNDINTIIDKKNITQALEKILKHDNMELKNGMPTNKITSTCNTINPSECNETFINHICDCKNYTSDLINNNEHINNTKKLQNSLINNEDNQPLYDQPCTNNTSSQNLYENINTYIKENIDHFHIKELSCKTACKFNISKKIAYKLIIHNKN